MFNVENVRQMYHQHQNKWCTKGVYLPISNLHSILAVANLLAHILVYVLMGSEFGTAKIKCTIAS